jgi:hypothetical protein
MLVAVGREVAAQAGSLLRGRIWCDVEMVDGEVSDCSPKLLAPAFS